jgi:hypothetical protein
LTHRKLKGGPSPTKRLSNGIRKTYHLAQSPRRPMEQLQQMANYARASMNVQREPSPNQAEVVAAGDDANREEILAVRDHSDNADEPQEPTHMQSSPPDSPSSYSSSSTESSSSEDEPTPSSEIVEEKEWQDAFEPHQRAIGDALTHISKQLLRNIVDKATAVDDIANLYARDGTEFIQKVASRHTEVTNNVLPRLEGRKIRMRKELQTMAHRLRKTREAVEAQEKKNGHG